MDYSSHKPHPLLPQARQKFFRTRHRTSHTFTKAALGLPTHSRRNCRRPKFHTGSQLHVTPHHQLRFPDSTFNDSKMPVCASSNIAVLSARLFYEPFIHPFFPDRTCPSILPSQPSSCWNNDGHDHYANAVISPEPQVVPHQAEACQGAEAEPPCAPMDQTPNRQHHPVRDLNIRGRHHWCFASYVVIAVEETRERGTAVSHSSRASTNVKPIRYNAKRRHWRKTRLGI